MKIKLLPYQPHCFAFGGFEIQMLSTLSAIQEQDVDAEMMDVWSKDQNFDILHCWGLGVANYENIYWAKQAGKKVIVTALLPYYDSLKEKLKYVASSLIYKAKLMHEMANLVDHFVVISDIQAEVLSKYFNVNKKRISVIPNIVNDKFYSINKDQALKFNQKFNTSNFILSTGNIRKIKNQVNLAKACEVNGKELVIIGKVFHGEEEYASELERIVDANKNILWIKGLEQNSDDLVHAYAACKIFALPGHDERQPISLLEAAAASKPLLIANRTYAKQKYYKNAKLVDPDSPMLISKAILDIESNLNRFLVPKHILEECRAENVGKAYSDVYKTLLYKA